MLAQLRRVGPSGENDSDLRLCATPLPRQASNEFTGVSRKAGGVPQRKTASRHDLFRQTLSREDLSGCLSHLGKMVKLSGYAFNCKAYLFFGVSAVDKKPQARCFILDRRMNDWLNIYPSVEQRTR